MTDHSTELRKAHRAHQRARRHLFHTIHAALHDPNGPTISQIARDTGFTREYIHKLKNGHWPADVSETIHRITRTAEEPTA